MACNRGHSRSLSTVNGKPKLDQRLHTLIVVAPCMTGSCKRTLLTDEDQLRRALNTTPGNEQLVHLQLQQDRKLPKQRSNGIPAGLLIAAHTERCGAGGGYDTLPQSTQEVCVCVCVCVRRYLIRNSFYSCSHLFRGVVCKYHTVLREVELHHYCKVQ